MSCRSFDLIPFARKEFVSEITTREANRAKVTRGWMLLRGIAKIDGNFEPDFPVGTPSWSESCGVGFAWRADSDNWQDWVGNVIGIVFDGALSYCSMFWASFALRQYASRDCLLEHFEQAKENGSKSRLMEYANFANFAFAPISWKCSSYQHLGWADPNLLCAACNWE